MADPLDVMHHVVKTLWPEATMADGVTTNFTTAANHHNPTLHIVNSADSIR